MTAVEMIATVSSVSLMPAAANVPFLCVPKVSLPEDITPAEQGLIDSKQGSNHTPR